MISGAHVFCAKFQAHSHAFPAAAGINTALHGPAANVRRSAGPVWLCLVVTHSGDVAEELPVQESEVQGHVSSCLSLQHTLLLRKREALLEWGHILKRGGAGGVCRKGGVGQGRGRGGAGEGHSRAT